MDCLEKLLPGLAGRRDGHTFVDLLAQPATEHGRTVVLPEPLADLARGKGTSALARACRRVPRPA